MDPAGPADDAILIRWDDQTGHWLVSIEQMEPLSAIGVLHLAIRALADDLVETAVVWEPDAADAETES